ncbi:MULTISPECIES: DUF3489 domain-containing protein [Nitrosomonas]|uniref:Uncharacterized protein DUF3489 n=1 Tax=Nitrosomonas communis TaxID=44574 RepID=A0A0F7KFC4_9PROT|nr:MULTISPECIES: DUF3489 domain-containing protein [Nitrosomonas]AKH37569.1 hypothetical protein AAW31_06640 [Nitrosomonas communis]TYP78489.1 uncharacterized protein DUF3489 [Nitrosomonas communis]UVS62831.1 DUF3489 domain-containing protein [Nitrosomonas sp. PLL12]
MTMQLSPTQQQILSHAAECADGKLIWFPENIKGGARTKVIESLSKRALITIDKTDWFVSEQGYAALGLPHQETISSAAPDSVKEVQAAHTQKPRARDNSKQAQVIAMLKRPEGATIDQLCEITGWQSHTVRGALAGALKKKLGLTITSDKLPGDERVYRIGS